MRSYNLDVTPLHNRNSMAVKFDTEQRSLHIVTYFENAENNVLECKTVSLEVGDVRAIMDFMEMYLQEVEG